MGCWDSDDFFLFVLRSMQILKVESDKWSAIDKIYDIFKLGGAGGEGVKIIALQTRCI